MPTFENPSLKTNHLPLSCPLNCESCVKALPAEGFGSSWEMWHTWSAQNYSFVEEMPVTVTAKKHHSRDLIAAVLFLKLSASEKLVLQALCWH